MFEVGDLVEGKVGVNGVKRVLGFVEVISDDRNRIGVRWLNNGNDNHLATFINALDYLRKVDSIDERGNE